MNIFYYGMQRKIVTFIVCSNARILSIPCLAVSFLLFLLLRCAECIRINIVTEQYALRCVVKCLCVKIFEKKENEKSRSIHTLQAHEDKHIFAKRYKMDYVAFFPSFYFVFDNKFVEKCIFIITFEDR